MSPSLTLPGQAISLWSLPDTSLPSSCPRLCCLLCSSHALILRQLIAKNQTKEPTPRGKTNGSVLPFPMEKGIFYSQVKIQQQNATKNISLFPQEMKPGKLAAPECCLKMIRFMTQPLFGQKQCLKGSDIRQCGDEFISALINDI